MDVVLAGMKLIETVTVIVRESQSGKLSPQTALAKLQMINAALDANNATADAKLRAKFGRDKK